MKTKYTFTLIATFFLCSKVMAFGLDTFNNLHLQMGTWLENYDKVRVNKDDDTNGFELNPYISVGLEYDLSTSMIMRKA